MVLLMQGINQRTNQRNKKEKRVPITRQKYNPTSFKNIPSSFSENETSQTALTNSTRCWEFRAAIDRSGKSSARVISLQPVEKSITPATLLKSNSRGLHRQTCRTPVKTTQWKKRGREVKTWWIYKGLYRITPSTTKWKSLFTYSVLFLKIYIV